MIRRVLSIIGLGLFINIAFAEADGTDYWRVVNVKSGGALNVRSGPSTAFKIIGEIPSGAIELRNEGCTPEFTNADWQRFTEKETEIAARMRWCRVTHSDVSGWVYAYYLRE